MTRKLKSYIKKYMHEILNRFSNQYIPVLEEYFEHKTNYIR